MFGGFCLLFVFCCALAPPGQGVTFFVWPDFFWLLGQIFLIRIPLPFGSVFGEREGGFCLESLILAQDERWRRA